jgi:glucosamine-6-phosphate deaminase
MKLNVFPSKVAMGQAAADLTARSLNTAIGERGEAHLILATGASQFEMLQSLVVQDVDWSKVTAFHLDEYIGLPLTHPASFRKYLHERFVAKLPALHVFHDIDGEADDPAAECRRLGALISKITVDVACIGIGENGHVAFNDPPADFDTDEPYIIVDLDEACRRQQTGEGWFASVDDVPARAISMSVREIMRAKRIVCTVPDARKAGAVRDALEGDVTNAVPASILQRHPDCHLFADEPAVALLRTRP